MASSVPPVSANSDAAASLKLKLYVAGVGPNSLRARANLDRLVREHLGGNCTICIEDVLENPESALAEGLVVTPTLVRVAPKPKVRVVGDLSDIAAVLNALGVKGTRP